MRYLLFLLIIVLPFCLLSQPPRDDFWDGEDTSLVMTRDDLMNTLFGSLTPSNYPSGLILQRSDMISPIEDLRANPGMKINVSQWLSMYADFRNMHASPASMPNSSQFFEDVLEVHKTYGLAHEGPLVPFGILDFDYDIIDSNAIGSLLYYSGMELHDYGGSSKSAFSAASVTALAPLVDSIIDDTLYFVLDPAFFFTNKARSVVKVDFNINSGAAVFTLNAGQETAIENAFGNYIEIAYKIYFSDASTVNGNTVMTSNSKMERLTDILVDYVEGLILDRTLTVSSPIDNSPVRLKYRVYNGCGTEGKILKPYFLVSGFNPFSFNSISKFERVFNENGLLDMLMAEGYSIIIVKFENGVDRVVNSSAALRALINQVNTEKFNNGSFHENVLVGSSLGAIICRHALTTMEMDFLNNGGEHHHSRLMGSYDGEHQGGNLGLGDQHMIQSIIDNNIGLLSLILNFTQDELLNSDAAEEMLLYHHSQTGSAAVPGQGPHNLRADLLDDLANLNHAFTPANLDGYPAFTRLMGIANGSNDNVEDPFNFDQGDVLFSFNQTWPLGLYVKRQRVRDRAIAGNSANFPVFQRLLQYIYGFYTITIVNEHFATSNPIPVDNSPAGFAGFHNAMVTAGQVAFWEFFPETNLDVDVSFTPVVSTLDIRNDNGDFRYDFAAQGLLFTDDGNGNVVQSNFMGYPHLGVVNPTTRTPFDVIYVDEPNGVHSRNETPELSAMIFGEVAPYELFLQNRQMGFFENGIEEYRADFEARTSLTSGRDVTLITEEGDFAVTGNASVSFAAGEFVHLQPGFHSNQGSEFHAYIKPPSCEEPESPFARTGKKDREDDPKSESTLTESIAQQSETKVYPNPSEGLFKIQSASEIDQVIVNSILGAEMYSVSGNGKKQLDLDLSGFAPGIYLLSIIEGSNRTTMKIVIESTR